MWGLLASSFTLVVLLGVAAIFGVLILAHARRKEWTWAKYCIASMTACFLAAIPVIIILSA